MDAPAARSRPADALVAALAFGLGLAGLLALAALVRGGPLAIDATGVDLAKGLGAGPATAILDLANRLGSLPVWIVIVAAVALVLVRTSVRAAAVLVLVNVAAEAASTGVKLLVDRPRPSAADVTDLFVASGFPSGHVTRIAFTAGALLVLVPWCRRHPRATIAAGTLAVMVMAVARVWASAHYPTDVIAAVFLGVVALAGWVLVAETFARRR